MRTRIEAGPSPRRSRRPPVPRIAMILAASLAVVIMGPLAWADDAAGRQEIAQSLNLAWVLLCGFLVMFMQVGSRCSRPASRAPRMPSTRWR